MHGEDTAKLKTAQLFLYIVHTDILDRVFPALVFIVLDAVEDKPPCRHAQRNTQAGHILTIGNGFMEVLAVYHIEHGIAYPSNHKNGTVSNEAEAPAFFVEFYPFDLFIMHPNDIAARGIGHKRTPDGGHLPHIELLYKNAVVPDSSYPSIDPGIALGLQRNGKAGEKGFSSSAIVLFHHDEIAGLGEGHGAKERG